LPPKIITTNFIDIQFSHNGECLSDSILFQLSSSNIDSTIWDFGDPLSGSANVSKLFSPSHLYTSSGSYIVSCIAHKNCLTDTIYGQIEVYQAPILEFGKDTILCYSNNLILDATFPGANYLWQDNSMLPTYYISMEGTYWVSVTNVCGKTTDTINVQYKDCDYNIYIPNAFTPNGDGMNDRFKVIGKGIKNIYLAVYNRWGEKVYETGNLYEALNVGWDGKRSALGGRRKEQGMAVFVYYLEVEFVDRTTDTRKGDVTLIR